MIISCSRMTVKAMEVKLLTKLSSVLVEAQCLLTKFSVKRLSGKHTMISTQEGVLALVEHLLPAQVYSNIPGRAHSAFEGMPNSLLDAIDCEKLKTWISQSLKKFSTKYYQI